MTRSISNLRFVGGLPNGNVRFYSGDLNDLAQTIPNHENVSKSITLQNAEEINNPGLILTVAIIINKDNPSGSQLMVSPENRAALPCPPYCKNFNGVLMNFEEARSYIEGNPI